MIRFIGVPPTKDVEGMEQVDEHVVFFTEPDLEKVRVALFEREFLRWTLFRLMADDDHEVSIAANTAVKFVALSPEATNDTARITGGVCMVPEQYIHLIEARACLIHNGFEDLALYCRVNPNNVEMLVSDIALQRAVETV